ncbi:MAG: hypothetical protein LBK57_05710 [Clostridiales Family XIII bacterium]|jgi:hypothetical protein|nr:hypothetical protein [Clostridiales Family XIII bacterium]
MGIKKIGLTRQNPLVSRLLLVNPIMSRSYTDERLTGGLFAAASSFMEDMDDTFILLREWINNSGDFDLDKSRQEMIEEILPWDIANRFSRYQQDIFIPIRIKDEKEPQI